jgi:predicted transcriptional regulator
VFSKPNSILLSTEKIVDKAVERHADMQTTKKGKQLFENIKDSAAL